MRSATFIALASLVLVGPAGLALRPVVSSDSTSPPSADDVQQGGDIVQVKIPRRRAAPLATAPGESAGERQEAYGSRRIQVFLVPIGESAGLAAGQAQAALEREVDELPGYHPVDLVKELAVPPTERDRHRLAQALDVERDGDHQIAQHAYDEAVSRYQKAIRLLEHTGNALTAAVWADAWTRLAVALTLDGESRGAQQSFEMAARADLAGAVDGRRIDPRLGAGLDQARGAIAKGADGALSILTTPPGARVFLGGVYKGTTPLTIQNVAAGENFVRLDRPGALVEVRVVDVKPADDTPLRVAMRFTPEAQALQRTLVRVPRALEDQSGIPDMLQALGDRFRLQRAVFATVQMTGVETARVRMVVVDYDRRARLADETKKFAIHRDGTAEPVIARWARAVLDRAGHSRNRASSDPLDTFNGTEGWYDHARRHGKKDPDAPAWDQHHYKPTNVLKPGKGSDPLNSENGTEDW